MNNAITSAMDNIVVRPLRFDCSKIEAKNPVWSRTNPLFSIYINSLGIHVPYFERYLIAGLRKVRAKIKDEQLLKDVSSIIGQEAHHAINFININKFFMERYPEVRSLDARAKLYFEKKLEKDDLKSLLGYIAGYETFTYLGGMIILKGYKKWMLDADPVLRSVWLWHQVEEVEHGSVAFDVYRYFFEKNEWYRKWMVLKSFAHIGTEITSAYIPMARREGYFSSPIKAFKAIGFLLSFTAQLAYSALPVLSRRYHPRNHPMCSTMQNPIALSWTKFYTAGDDVLQLNNEKMNEIVS